MRRVPIIAAALLLAAGCAKPGTGPGGPGGSAEPTVDPGRPEWGTFAVTVTGVRPGPDARTALVDVEVATGREGCSREPKIDRYTEEDGRVYASVVQEVVVKGCPSKAPGVATLTAPAPLGERMLVLNEEAWTPAGAQYRKCDKELGCDPPADHCDSTWVRAAVRGLDVSRHSQGSVEACDGTWLVMTVPDDPVACGAGGRPGCTPRTTIRRYFMRFAEGHGWTTVSGSTGPGCGQVASVEPAFPTRLCVDLPAPG
ncbi:hypothetical protein [Dactylosporangium salmoneum]